MKKLLAVLAAAGAAILVALSLRSRTDTDPWHEATTR
ncbi:DLW-39 family protein [Pseudonocardia xishanensis]